MQQPVILLLLIPGGIIITIFYIIIYNICLTFISTALSRHWDRGTECNKWNILSGISVQITGVLAR